MRRVIAAAVALLCAASCSRHDAPTRDSGRATRRADSAAMHGAAATSARPDSVVRVTTMFTLTSPAFQSGDSIPRQYTCDGADMSPPLDWLTPPSGTASFALIVEDPDAPGGTFIHWVLYDLPGSSASLQEAVPKSGELPQMGGARQGRTSFGRTGYGGPCPPAGSAHHYHFRLFALRAKLGFHAGASRDEIMNAMQAHELGRAELVGLYARAK
jgi:Raf kinase inhibitor-like YbhB/YbcL family protein